MLRRASARAAVVAALSAILAIGTAIPALAAVPKITSFSPISGPVGTSVTVLGSSFTGVTGVAFNGTSATYTVISANQINTTVPAAATTGPISVTNASGTAISSSNFTVTPPPASITVTPTSGPPTSTITVSGAGFGATEAVDVYFDTTDEALASTNGVGSFSGIPIPAPSTAVPGMHWVTGVGRHSGLAAQAPFTVQSDWAQFRFSAKHRGQNPYENVLSTSNVSNIDLDWSFHTPDPVESSPAVAGGVAYFGSNVGAVYAVNASTGTEVWASEIGQVTSSPAVANGAVYEGLLNGGVLAINASNGSYLWSDLFSAAVESSPAVAGGVVYVGSDDESIYALKALTGLTIWSHPTGGSVRSSPAVANGVLYVGSDDGYVYALSPSTGTQLWSFATGGFVGSSPTVANGTVYVGSDDDNLYAFDLAGGHAIPRRPDPSKLRPNLSLKIQG